MSMFRARMQTPAVMGFVLRRAGKLSVAKVWPQDFLLKKQPGERCQGKPFFANPRPHDARMEKNNAQGHNAQSTAMRPKEHV